MTSQRKAQALTLALMAGLGVFLLARQSRSGGGAAELPSPAQLLPQPKPDPTPQDAIYAMLDAAREGNVGAYRSFYTGAMADALAQSVTEQGDARFSAYLRDANTPIKGIAINEPQLVADREAKVRVEYVYQDRNEAQIMYLERQPDKQWKIARLENSERVKTLIPYGSPVQ